LDGDRTAALDTIVNDRHNVSYETCVQAQELYEIEDEVNGWLQAAYEMDG